MKTNKKSESTAPHIGKLLAVYIKKNNIFKSALARYLQHSAPAIEYYMKRPSLQTKIVWEISHALKHNFFADLAAELPAEFSSNIPIDTSKEEEIAQLKEANKVLQAKLEVLEKVMRKDK